MDGVGMKSEFTRIMGSYELEFQETSLNGSTGEPRLSKPQIKPELDLKTTHVVRFN